MTDPIKKRYELPEVVVTAKKTDPKRYKSAKQKIALYPNGEVEKTTIDSIRKTPHGVLVGKMIEKMGQVPRFGPEDSDLIRSMLRKQK